MFKSLSTTLTKILLFLLFFLFFISAAIASSTDSLQHSTSTPHLQSTTKTTHTKHIKRHLMSREFVREQRDYDVMKKRKKHKNKMKHASSPVLNKSNHHINQRQNQFSHSIHLVSKRRLKGALQQGSARKSLHRSQLLRHSKQQHRKNQHQKPRHHQHLPNIHSSSQRRHHEQRRQQRMHPSKHSSRNRHEHRGKHAKWLRRRRVLLTRQRLKADRGSKHSSSSSNQPLKQSKRQRHKAFKRLRDRPRKVEVVKVRKNREGAKKKKEKKKHGKKKTGFSQCGEGSCGLCAC